MKPRRKENSLLSGSQTILLCRMFILILSGFICMVILAQFSTFGLLWGDLQHTSGLGKFEAQKMCPPCENDVQCEMGSREIYGLLQRYTTPQNGFDQLVPFEEMDLGAIPPYDWDFYYPVNLEGSFYNREISKLHRNVIMGMASGYSYHQIRPFLASLRETGYSDDIILGVFMKDHDENFQKLVQKYDVMVYDLPDSFKANQSKAAIHRYAFYREWIYPYRGNDRFVIVADVRDTFFQQDPFKNTNELFPLGVNIHMIEEGRKETLGGNYWNKLKIEGNYGEEIHKYLYDKPIICSGVTIGRANAMYRYVKYISDSAITQKFVKDDQGYHNYLYYMGHFDSLGVRAQILGEGAICTVTYMDQLVRDSEGYVLIGPPTVERREIDPNDPNETRDMYRAPVVHQYDRSDELKTFAMKKWGRD